MARKWAKIDPQAAAEYALQTDQYDARRHLVASVSQSWSYIEPFEAAEWAQSFDEKASAGAMGRIVENWSRQDPAVSEDRITTGRAENQPVGMPLLGQVLIVPGFQTDRLCQ